MDRLSLQLTYPSLYAIDNLSDKGGDPDEDQIPDQTKH